MKHLMGPRMTSLLKNAARTFADGSSPFLFEWLSENEVTLDECMNMSEIIGSVIEWFADQSMSAQVKILLYGFHPEMAREIEKEK